MKFFSLTIFFVVGENWEKIQERNNNEISPYPENDFFWLLFSGFK